MSEWAIKHVDLICTPLSVSMCASMCRTSTYSISLQEAVPELQAGTWTHTWKGLTRNVCVREKQVSEAACE